MVDKIDIKLDKIMSGIKEMVGDDFDIVVAIGRGGVLPGYLVSRHLDIPLEIIYLNLRDESHREIRDTPLLTKRFDFNPYGKRILLADDVSNSGKTLRKAEQYLKGGKVTTMVISGIADISLFGPHNKCINWPWDKE